MRVESQGKDNNTYVQNQGVEIKKVVVLGKGRLPFIATILSTNQIGYKITAHI